MKNDGRTPQPSLVAEGLSVPKRSDYLVWRGNVETFLDQLPAKPLFDLIVTSPPYNIGKPYEKTVEIHEYKRWQGRIIGKLVSRLKDTGSICWQVGNFVSGSNGKPGIVYPLDFLFHELFEKEQLALRNRIIWRFGHGLHCRTRFSGRYEVILWYTRTDDYKFKLDGNVRIPAKYPSKKHYKGPRKGQFSGNPAGKNPEDFWEFPDDFPEFAYEDLNKWPIWEIPNVKSNHIEKTEHPCQFPVGLVERLILALTDKGDLVFDPFAGVGSSGVAAAIRGRRFWGCEINRGYASEARRRVEDALQNRAKYRPHDKPVYDHTKSKLSRIPSLFELK